MRSKLSTPRQHPATERESCETCIYPEMYTQRCCWDFPDWTDIEFHLSPPAVFVQLKQFSVSKVLKKRQQLRFGWALMSASLAPPSNKIPNYAALRRRPRVGRVNLRWPCCLWLGTQKRPGRIYLSSPSPKSGPLRPKPNPKPVKN